MSTKDSTPTNHSLDASHVNIHTTGASSYIHANPSKISLHKGDDGEVDIELSERVGELDLSKTPEIHVHSLSQEGVHTPLIKNPTRANVQFASLCWTLFLAGWNDGTTGPLLPRMQEVYHVGFAVVSLIFIANCVGFVAGSISNIYLTDRLGFGRVIVIGSTAQIVAYAIEAPAPPFPLFAIGFVVNGFGIALQDAQANGFVASYKENAAAKMGFLHAAYGAGALAAPLVATQFAQLHRWSFHYLVSLGIALSNAIILIAVFRFKTQDECLAQIGQAAGELGESEDSKYSQIFRLKAVHLLAFFILVYVGVEVTIGGWIVTFIIHVRGGGPSSGYISAGFFGGLTLGRVALLWVNEKIGERRVIFFYVVLAIALELVVWLVPSLIGGAVAVSVVGVLLGPIYPIVMNESGRILPRWLLTGSIGWIAGFGQTGSAALPFMTGAIASKAGIKSLQPLLVAMMALLLVLWALVPKGHSRAD
ncbi:MFS general substrate transporter [Auriscalpium vulgare]|uniref:MFS general substrate transporter n=1 Tax=Auriscalpium vulgare TaxID=40419 RepID=A0ACB8S7E1_9AGAM|nr:MFS general substrate transporter [Auriscalpium vulgare]